MSSQPASTKQETEEEEEEEYIACEIRNKSV